MLILRNATYGSIRIRGAMILALDLIGFTTGFFLRLFLGNLGSVVETDMDPLVKALVYAITSFAFAGIVFVFLRHGLKSRHAAVPRVNGLIAATTSFLAFWVGFLLEPRSFQL